MNSLMGRGIYDVAEIARLTSRPPGVIVRWVSGAGALHQVPEDAVMNFRDLISLLVISRAVRTGLPESKIGECRKYLSKSLNARDALAHRKAAVWFGFVSEWPITYENDGFAAAWRPHPRILIDPNIQAGAPCIEGTRVTTLTIAELAEDEDPLNYLQIAGDYRITYRDVLSAIDYERGLCAAG